MGSEIFGLSIETTAGDGFPSWGIYRQVGLIFNPTASANATAYQNTSFNQMYNFQIFSGSSILSTGEKIVGLNSKATAQVAYMNTSRMYVLNVVGTFQPYETVLSNDTGKTCTITVINSPDLVPYSGEVFYYKNIQPISRTGIKAEQVKLYFNF